MEKTPSKYAAQMKHINSKYASFKMNLAPEVLADFKAKCAANGTTATTELKKFITQYLAEN